MIWLFGCWKRRRRTLSAANFELMSSIPASFRLRINNVKRRILIAEIKDLEVTIKQLT